MTRFPAQPSRLMVMLTALVLAATACSSSAPGSEADTSDLVIVATTPVLGAVSAQIVDEQASVATVMPNGADPHGFAASAAQVNEILTADLLVVNGDGLEQSLADTIEQARSDGVPVFTATDQLESEPVAETGDPHFWLDPVSMQTVVAALGNQIDSELGSDVSEAADAYIAELDDLQARSENQTAQIPEDKRKLVTGHDALGYWAQRYGFEVIGAVVPSTSTQAEASAGELAELADTIADAGVRAIFTDETASAKVAEQIAEDTGTRVVELDVATLPDDGSYITLIANLTDTITTNLDSRK